MVKQYHSVMWTRHHQVMQDIEYINMDETLENQPIYVLDEDAKRCAMCFTTEHIKKYIEHIVYSTIMFRGTETIKKKSDVVNKPRVDYMYYNQRTAYWFFTLYKEMQEIHKKRFGKYYRVSEYFQDSWINNLDGVKGPKEIKLREYKAIRLPSDKSIRKKYIDIYDNYKWTIDKIKNRLGRFRVMYMIMGYLNSEFPCGAPAWYSNMKSTIWKSFNKMTRLYYRIDTNIEGIYSYYYSVDDKNWIEIPTIPFELRGLIDGIIFAREV